MAQARMTSYWQVGPMKGQPKLCMKCPTIVHINSNGWRLCHQHYKERKNAEYRRIGVHSPARLRAAIAGLTPPERTTPQDLTKRYLHNDGDYFAHLTPEQREIAEYEYNRQLNSGHNKSPYHFALIVARSIAWAKAGGRRELSMHAFHTRVRRKYWRTLAANHPELLPRGLDLNNLPSAKPKR